MKLFEVISLLLFLAPPLPAASIEEAMRLYASGKKTQARQMLVQIAQAEPSNFEAQFRLGLIALDSHDLNVALASLKRASQLQPSHPQVWVALAQTYSRLNNRKLAAAAAGKAEELASDDPVILHGLALLHSQNGNWGKAAVLESRYAARVPTDREAPIRAVSFYLQANQPKPAIDFATKALTRDKRADLHNLLGKAYEANGQFDKTVLELQQAIRLAPTEESYVFDLAYVLLVHQNFDVAIQVLEAAKTRFSQSAQLELALGIANYGQRQFAEAVDAFLRTTQLAPKVEQPYVFLARIINHGEGRLGEITERFARFAEANPKNYLGHFLHAKGLIAQMGPSVSSVQAKEAEALLNQSISLNPEFWESHFELGILLEGKREFAAAASHLERAVRLNPKAPAPHYRLARVYDRLGQPENAESERKLHEKLAAEERAAIEKHAAGLKRLELVVK